MKKQFGHYARHLFRHAEFICSATPHPCAFAWDCPIGTSSCGPASLKGPKTSSGRRTCFGRSMIEMLGVLAIIGVLSIGGIALYRRAVNNHHANTILDDVNRFAFVITEKGNYPLDSIIPKGDFKESGIYTLEGYQDVEANQFSITVADVPKGVCEPLLDKATVEYKVRVNPSANEKGKLYDTLNTDLCLDNNFMVFYFGDTTDLCNPKENGYTPCTQNSDCCGGEFCWLSYNTNCHSPGTGKCLLASACAYSTTAAAGTITAAGKKWIRSYCSMNWWGAQNWCLAQGKKPVSRADIGCTGVLGDFYCTTSPTLAAIQEQWGNYSFHWLEDYGNSCNAYGVYFNDSGVYRPSRYNDSLYALCLD